MRGTTLTGRNSVKESFVLKKKEFLTRLIERGYPQDLVERIMVDAQFSLRNFPFVRTFNPANQNVKKILMKHWHLISDNNNLVQRYPNLVLDAYRKVRSPRDSVFRAQLPSL